MDAALVVDVGGLMIAPGFIDVHSHAELTGEFGADVLPFVHRGIRTVAIRGWRGYDDEYFREIELERRRAGLPGGAQR